MATTTGYSISKYICVHSSCLYETQFLDRFISHTWDKHSLTPNFKHCCLISGCLAKFTNKKAYLYIMIPLFLISVVTRVPTSITMGYKRFLYEFVQRNGTKNLEDT